MDSLVPPIDGTILPFDEYWDISARLFAENVLLPQVRHKVRLVRPRYRGK